MSYLVRSEGSGFVAGSLGAIMILIAVFMLVFGPRGLIRRLH